MSKRWNYTLREVSAEVFVDKDSDFDPDFAHSLSNSSEQGWETGWQDGMDMTDSFWILFDVEDSVLTLQIFLLSLTAER